MSERGNIAWCIVRHNRADNYRRTNSRLPAVARLSLAILCASVGMGGCASHTVGRSNTEISLWQLAAAEPTPVVRVGRSRLSPNTPLPRHLIRNLSEEFDLVTIRTVADWRNFQQIVRLNSTPPDVDLTRGMIVGLVARVGEPARADWPIRFQAVREMSGTGLMEINFTPGLYHPVQTAAFLDLVYIPSLRHVQTVRINRRTFIMQPVDERPGGVHPAQERNQRSTLKSQC